jgi:hypothetical protein
MIDEPSPFKRPRFVLGSFRVRKAARKDSGYPHLRPKSDLQLLAAFLEQFEGLGWIPPVTDEKRALLKQCGVINSPSRNFGALRVLCQRSTRLARTVAHKFLPC